MIYDYSILSNEEKEKLIKQMYEVENLSFGDISQKLNTYPNRIRRDAKKFNIKIKNKSEAQKNALLTGKHQHPTKDKGHSVSTKKKIGTALVDSWERMDQSEIDRRRDLAKENWKNMSNDQKENMKTKANKAVRETSKLGSKLEHYIHEKLIANGYRVEFHREQALLNTKLQIDIYLPDLLTAIEIDGPSHFLPVWGDDALKKNIAYDQKKTGLILGGGMSIIRVKQISDFSPTRADIIVEKILDILRGMSDKSISQRSFLIEDKK
jgi:very-short-patch-repair endonuclease